MSHHTKDKGDLACAIAIADLSRKGYAILVPVVSEHLPFDLIAYKDGKCHRIQCKYSSDGILKRGTSWADKSGSHTRRYQQEDFDYYALYLHKIDKVIYPSISFAGRSINHEVPKTFLPFYWYEDFLDLADHVEKKTYRDFEGATGGSTSGLRGSQRKVQRPSAEELSDLLWAMPTTHIAHRFGVTDKAVQKWAEAYGISKPPRGYWNKQKAAP